MTQDWPRHPAEAIRSYRERGFREDRPLSGLLREQAARRGDRLALVSRSTRLTYAELDSRVDRLAHGLAALPVRAGERVLVRLPNREEYVLTLFALLRIGAVPVLALPALGPAEVESLAATAEACALVVADRHGRTDPRAEALRIAERLPHVRHVLVAGDPGDAPARSLDSLLSQDAAPRPEAARPEDLALLLLSGGTTGTPKLIPRTHADYGYNARASAQACAVDSDTVYLAVLPVAHNFTMVSPGIMGVLGAGGTVVLSPDPSPTTAFALIEQEGVTLTSLVPALVPSWLDEARRTPERPSSLRVLQVGGSRLDEVTARRIGPELGCTLQQVFGMAEGLNNYTPLDAPEEVVCTTQGRPLSPADEILIVDEDDTPVPPGVPGELLTRGPYTLRGYYRAREPDSLRFTPDGFYRTGDLVTRTPDGDLVVVGRVKDQVNRAGEKIAAVEVEEHLLALPGVRASAVVGMPDPHLGERSVAFLVAEGPAPSREEIRAAMLRRGVAPFKVPDEVRTAPALPLTGVGKVDKRRLREEAGR
ncbi:(2,3-dihydroxybenzoyl)adenylate synthase [Nocardiopsis lambiniae]|uniref:AMP-binding protein n=1 Tax=Nocardiopsis lambiniae TaxID=3075539 RepID=A0ABU2M9T9_9ACTN|nr:AMP-binding protein [Nocardiopsis sp. DSM 44743]MDT0329434.1 AMP-binding protein [Nocardiopsis sp. DSM 44743]